MRKICLYISVVGCSLLSFYEASAGPSEHQISRLMKQMGYTRELAIAALTAKDKGQDTSIEATVRHVAKHSPHAVPNHLKHLAVEHKKAEAVMMANIHQEEADAEAALHAQLEEKKKRKAAKKAARLAVEAEKEHSAHATEKQRLADELKRKSEAAKRDSAQRLAALQAKLEADTSEESSDEENLSASELKALHLQEAAKKKTAHGTIPAAMRTLKRAATILTPPHSVSHTPPPTHSMTHIPSPPPPPLSHAASSHHAPPPPPMHATPPHHFPKPKHSTSVPLDDDPFADEEEAIPTEAELTPYIQYPNPTHNPLMKGAAKTGPEKKALYHLIHTEQKIDSKLRGYLKKLNQTKALYEAVHGPITRSLNIKEIAAVRVIQEKQRVISVWFIERAHPYIAHYFLKRFPSQAAEPLGGKLGTISNLQQLGVLAALPKEMQQAFAQYATLAKAMAGKAKAAAPKVDPNAMMNAISAGKGALHSSLKKTGRRPSVHHAAPVADTQAAKIQKLAAYRVQQLADDSPPVSIEASELARWFETLGLDGARAKSLAEIKGHFKL